MRVRVLVIFSSFTSFSFACFRFGSEMRANNATDPSAAKANKERRREKNLNITVESVSIFTHKRSGARATVTTMTCPFCNTQHRKRWCLCERCVLDGPSVCVCTMVCVDFSVGYARIVDAAVVVLGCWTQSRWPHKFRDRIS